MSEQVALRLRESRARVAVARWYGVVAASLLLVLFDLNFNPLALIGSDQAVQFGFVRRLFGEVPHAQGYLFGWALVEAPAYGVGKLLAAVGLAKHVTVLQPVAVERGSGPASIALSVALLVLVSVGALAYLIDRLGLRRPGFSIGVAVFGSPLLYYTVFEPGKDHAADAVLFTLVLVVVFAYFRSERPRDRLAVLLGALLGFSITVRYFAGAELVALGVVLAYLRRWRHAAVVLGTTALVTLALFAIPLSLGVPVFAGRETPQQYGTAALVLAPLNPLRMLFTNYRGLFVWTPVTALGCIGFARLVWTRPRQRPFLVAAAAMGLAIVASYAFVPWWNTYSFSQRYFTPLFPLVAIGVAGLLDALGRRIALALQALALASVAWSLFLLFNLVTIGGPRYRSDIGGGATDVAAIAHDTHQSVGSYGYGIYYRSRLLRPLFAWPFNGSAPAR